MPVQHSTITHSKDPMAPEGTSITTCRMALRSVPALCPIWVLWAVGCELRICCQRLSLGLPTDANEHRPTIFLAVGVRRVCGETHLVMRHTPRERWSSDS